MDSFIKVSHVFVETQSTLNLTQRLTGRKPVTYSLLRDINVQTSVGTWLTVFGASGSGKTTLLHLLSGAITPSRGHIVINGKSVTENKQAAAGYVSSEESENIVDTVRDVLGTFGQTHSIQQAAARIATIADTLRISPLLDRPANTLSKSERIKVNMARAVLSDAPVLLFDDVADELGTEEIKRILGALCQGRTVLLTTRFTHTAEKLELPIVLLHNGTLAHIGTCEEIADTLACSRVLDAWVENLRYDLLRTIRKQPGVREVRLLPTDQFAGQHLRITLLSSRYLPALYDLISQTSLIRVQEVPPTLNEILAKL